MYRERCCCIAIAVLLFSPVLWAFDGVAALDVNSEETQDSVSSTSRILAVTDLVLQRHIDPPARQQMILSGVKALYRADNRPITREVSGRVSELATRDQISEYLDGVRREFSELPGADEVLMRGVLQSLPGRSFLIDMETNKVDEQVRNNRYVGTGIALAMHKEEKLAQIIKVFYNGPAWKAGIKLFDLIVEVDGDAKTSSELIKVVEALRGEAGSDVEMVVRQPDSDDMRRLTVTRGRVFIPSVEGYREISDGQWQYAVNSAKEIALIRIRSFGPSTLHELRQVAAKLRGEDCRGVIIDLRRGGGLLHDTIMVADSLLDGGTIGFVHSWDASVKHEASPGDLFQGLPIAVLVGKQTSPGNVFLTAALQDNGRAVVVGEPTEGETYAASIVPIPGLNEQIRLATAVMLRSDGTPLLPGRSVSIPLAKVDADDGDAEPTKRKRPGFIMPDHVVHQPPRTEAADRKLVTNGIEDIDPVLAKAVEVLQQPAADVSSPPQDHLTE